MPRSDRRIDVLIGGAGFAGLALAVALRQALGPSFSVVVADPALPPDRGSRREGAANGRASAIVAAARALFATMGVWGEIESQPILSMVVTDSRLTDLVRPTFLTFDGEAEPGEPFAHMVENAPLIAALLAKAQAEGILLRATRVADFEASGEHVAVRLADGEELATGLLVAADGAASAIREHAGIPSRGWRYEQSAIVTTVAHERDHGGRAEEHFLPAGPFAILPLTGRRSSIVWTQERREAERLIGLPEQEFHQELERRFGLRLGEITVAGARHLHPLMIAVAREFVGDRLALIGDAAHVIHPIAGQGLNMGLKDAAALAEVIVEAVRLGLDPGSADVLERYQRWRRFDSAAMGLVTDALNRLFSNEWDALRVVRDVGLGLVDRMEPLKRFFIREAAGLVGEVPKLLRGEPL